MIARILHCVWLSGEPIPAGFARNLDTAKALHPDFEVRVWTAADAATIDSRFLREALEQRKWAFATDIIRLFALENYGGVYFDLDVRFHGAVSPWLTHDCVIGWESDYLLGPHLLMAEKGHPFIAKALKLCRDRVFQLDADTLDTTPLPTLMTWLARQEGLILDGSRQILGGGLVIEPAGVFTLNLMDGRNCCEHLYAGSWLDSPGSFASELLHRYARTNRFSARLVRAVAGLLPHPVRRYVSDVFNSRYAFPGAYEASGYSGVRGRVNKAVHVLKIVSRLNEFSPLVVRSKYHVSRRKKAALSPARASYLGWDPSVDVIVPIYNVEAYLDRCLHSLHRQSHHRLRVLMVDDGLNRAGFCGGRFV